MKRLTRLFSILCISGSLFVLPCQAQDVKPVKTLDGFLDITWDNSYNIAQKKILKRKGVHLDKESTDSARIVVRGGELGGEPVSYMQLAFYKERFAAGAVHFEHVAEHKVLSLYATLKDLITEKYGKPDRDQRDFVTPYWDGDGYETQAIRNGKATIASAWQFPIEAGLGYGIILMVKDDLSIELGYLNLELTHELSREDKKRSAKEF